MMTSAQIHRTLKLYEAKLEELLKKEYWRGLHKEYSQLVYLQDMIPRFPHIKTNREKAMRWLCFMQGVFWSLDIYTVEEMGKHNSDPATKVDIARIYHQHSLIRNVACSLCGDLDGCHHWSEYESAPAQ